MVLRDDMCVHGFNANAADISTRPKLPVNKNGLFA
jgi:hypothetical protein